MSDRTVQLDDEVECDVCGKKGAFDFYGDFICSDCLRRDKERDYTEGK